MNAEQEKAEMQAALEEVWRRDELGKAHRHRLRHTLPTLAEIYLNKVLWCERGTRGLLELQSACYCVLNKEPVLSLIPIEPRP